MRLTDIMTKNVVQTTSSRSAADAFADMQRRGIHHLVVVDAGKVVGVVSDRDLGGARAATTRAQRQVADYMTRTVVSATPETTVRQAANLLRGRGVGCLPVFAGDKLTGIVTTTDLLDMIGRGMERSVVESKRWTLSRRGANRRATEAARKAPAQRGKR